MVGVFALVAVLVSAPPPAQDFDKDGIVDLSDDCPTDPGSPKNKGCPGAPPPPAAPTEEPRIQVSNDRIDLSEKVMFRSGSASVDPRSFSLLQEIGRAIQALPATKRVAIAGHTDNRGKRKMNRRLSKRRAEGVIAHLVRAGVARNRLEPRGHGPDKPIAKNTTKAGRAKNRRVEFIILDGDK